MFKEVHAYFSATPAAALDISQRGMLAVGYGARVQIWRDGLAVKAAAPYLNHTCCGGGIAVGSLKFCPYDDVLAVGHSEGVTSMLARPRYSLLVRPALWFSHPFGRLCDAACHATRARVRCVGQLRLGRHSNGNAEGPARRGDAPAKPPGARGDPPPPGKIREGSLHGARASRASKRGQGASDTRRAARAPRARRHCATFS